MGKKKQSGELKSIPLPIQVHRYRLMNDLVASATEHWGVENIQPFFPSLETMFKMENLDAVRDHGLKLDEPIKTISSSNTITTLTGETRNIHIKQTMVVSPHKWMRGDYGGSIGLPTIQEDADQMIKKIQSPHNAAYVGSLFSALFSQSGCIHFPKVYGVFTGIAKKHTIDISDEYEDLVEKQWFSQNLGSRFELKLADEIAAHSEFKHTRDARTSVILSDETTLGEIESISGMSLEGNIEMPELRSVFEEEELDTGSTSDCSDVSTAYVFDVRSCDCSEDEDEGEDDDGEGFAWATMSNVPVQLTVMEKCEGTLGDLLLEVQDTSHVVAWLAQVLFSLTYAQRVLGFTHNDLHSNNIMYVKTEKEFLHYKVDGQMFKVPTYGYIMKLIDFERGVGSVRVAGMKHPKTFVSDHFSPEEEAGGQYNIDPFRVQSYEMIKPNPSFDLVRLATSIFWDLFSEGPNCEEYKSNPIFMTLMRWLTLEDGTSVLFGKDEENHDRYHGFHLYKAIARYCKDTAIPRREVIRLIPVFGFSGQHPIQFDLVI